MEQQLVHLVIDGQSVSVPPGSTVLQAAQSVGIDIPTFCHHPKLTPIGACRMCLVEIERMKGLQPACSTVVRDGLVVHVNTPACREAREWVLRFLLTNHPLDCPVCDKGGECTLQDQAMAHGPGESLFVETKRHKKKAHPVSPFIILDQERCVLCRRCLRFGEEVSDHIQLGVFERGRLTELDIFPGQPFDSKFSGNTIDLCPVGALTSRVARFQARSWEMARTPGICTHCGVGCNLDWGVKNNRLRRVTPRENAAINDQWLCDKGRFAHDFVQADGRLRRPLVRRDGELREATWEEAYEAIARGVGEAVEQGGPAAVAGLGSTRVTNEAAYLFQRLLRAVVGSNNVAHMRRLPQGAALLQSFASLAEADLVMLAGVDPSEELPLLDLWIKQAVLRRGAKVLVLHPQRVELSRYAGRWLAYRPGAESAVANGLIKAILAAKKGRAAGNLEAVEDGLKADSLAALAETAGLSVAQLQEAADLLTAAKNAWVLTGEGWGGDALPALANLSAVGGAHGPFYLADDSNTVGASDMGLLPDCLPGGQRLEDTRVRDRLSKWWGVRKLSDNPGLPLEDLWPAVQDGRVKALLVLGSDPVEECAVARQALGQARFLVVQDLFLTATARLAHVVLPAAGPAAEEGTYTNLQGRVQHSGQGLRPLGETRPDWQILQELALRLLPLTGANATPGAHAWAFEGPGQVFAELAKAAPAYEGLSYASLGEFGALRLASEGQAALRKAPARALPADAAYPLILWVGRALYDRGTLAACSQALQTLVAPDGLWLHPDDAARAGLAQGAAARVRSALGEVTLPTRLDREVPRGVALATRNLGESSLGALLAPGSRVAQVQVEPA
ncbi:MAG: NADH-quinone oxidoreductase subunit NuoG [Chloroflexi bacterium]|nr:NADH-quinone oxidoreductase subunit NuoG [Chloroflexota bacterium]